MSDQNDKESSSPLPPSDLKAKRDEYLQEAQKQKREEKLNLDRERILGDEQKMEEELDPEKDKNEENQLLEELKKQWLEQAFSEANFPELLKAVSSDDRSQQLYGLIGLNKILNTTNIQTIIDANLVPIIIKLMVKSEEPHLQKAVELVKIITAGTTQQVQVIVDKGVITALSKLLKCGSEKILEEVFIAIGNIAGDAAIYRDMILKNPGLSPLLEVVDKTNNKELIKLGTWAISNLCRGKPLPPLELIESAIPTLSAIFQREQDIDVLNDAAWALSYLSRGENQALKVLNTGIIPRLVHYFDYNDDRLVTPCLRIIGNFCTLSKDQNRIESYGQEFLPKLFKMIQNPRLAIRRETCWVLSNITAGDSSDINFILNDPFYVDMLIRIMKTDVPEVALEATWVLSNAMKNMCQDRIPEILDLGTLDAFLHLLNAENVKMVEVALEAINNILNWGEALAVQNHCENEALILLTNKGGIEKLENLQTHKSRSIYLKAFKILECFYEGEDLLL